VLQVRERSAQGRAAKSAAECHADEDTAHNPEPPRVEAKHCDLIRRWSVRAPMAAAQQDGSLGSFPDSPLSRDNADIGHGDLGIFGHPTSRTPWLDKMATEGAKLTMYESGANVCSPSRASIMTGRYYTRAGAYPGVFSPNSVGGLPLNETTIAKALIPAGYTSGMVGKVGTRWIIFPSVTICECRCVRITLACGVACGI
jgi:hypothetical protein